MSEQVPEETGEQEETEEQPEEERESEQPTPDDKAKLEKALGRERAAKKKIQSELAALRKQMQEGTPNGDETEQLKKQMGELKVELDTSRAITALLGAGYNGNDAQARRFLKQVDDLSDMEAAIEELKEDYPEKFGRRRAEQQGTRPYTGGGRDSPGGQSKSSDAKHIDKLLQMGRR